MCQHPPAPHGRYVLVVDDSAINRRLLGRQLAKLGYDAVLEVADGLAAVKLVFSRGIDSFAFVLLDLQMPVLDGWQVLRLLRAHDRTARLPILACTALDPQEQLPRCSSSAGGVAQPGVTVEQSALALGADACLSKPLSLLTLGAALAQLAPRPPGWAGPGWSGAATAAAVAAAHEPAAAARTV